MYSALFHLQYHDWGETLEQGTKPPTAPRRFITHCCVCALGCRALILSMGHYTWPHVTYFHFLYLPFLSLNQIHLLERQHEHCLVFCEIDQNEVDLWLKRNKYLPIDSSKNQLNLFPIDRYLGTNLTRSTAKWTWGYISATLTWPWPEAMGCISQKHRKLTYIVDPLKPMESTTINLSLRCFWEMQPCTVSVQHHLVVRR